MSLTGLHSPGHAEMSLTGAAWVTVIIWGKRWRRRNKWTPKPTSVIDVLSSALRWNSVRLLGALISAGFCECREHRQTPIPHPNYNWLHGFHPISKGPWVLTKLQICSSASALLDWTSSLPITNSKDDGCPGEAVWEFYQTKVKD